MRTRYNFNQRLPLPEEREIAQRTANIDKKQPANYQDIFLNCCRKGGNTVTVKLCDGSTISGQVIAYDQNVLIIEHNAKQYILYKYSVLSVCGAPQITNFT